MFFGILSEINTTKKKGGGRASKQQQQLKTHQKMENVSDSDAITVSAATNASSPAVVESEKQQQQANTGNSSNQDGNLSNTYALSLPLPDIPSTTTTSTRSTSSSSSSSTSIEAVDVAVTDDDAKNTQEQEEEDVVQAELEEEDEDQRKKNKGPKKKRNTRRKSLPLLSPVVSPKHLNTMKAVSASATSAAAVAAVAASGPASTSNSSETDEQQQQQQAFIVSASPRTIQRGSGSSFAAAAGGGAPSASAMAVTSANEIFIAGLDSDEEESDDKKRRHSSSNSKDSSSSNSGSSSDNSDDDDDNLDSTTTTTTSIQEQVVDKVSFVFCDPHEAIASVSNATGKIPSLNIEKDMKKQCLKKIVGEVTSRGLVRCSVHRPGDQTITKNNGMYLFLKVGEDGYLYFMVLGQKAAAAAAVSSSSSSSPSSPSSSSSSSAVMRLMRMNRVGKVLGNSNSSTLVSNTIPGDHHLREEEKGSERHRARKKQQQLEELSRAPASRRSLPTYSQSSAAFAPPTSIQVPKLPINSSTRSSSRSSPHDSQHLSSHENTDMFREWDEAMLLSGHTPAKTTLITTTKTVTTSVLDPADREALLQAAIMQLSTTYNSIDKVAHRMMGHSDYQSWRENSYNPMDSQPNEMIESLAKRYAEAIHGNLASIADYLANKYPTENEMKEAARVAAEEAAKNGRSCAIM